MQSKRFLVLQGGCVGIEVTESGEPATEECMLEAVIDGRGTFVMQGSHDYVGNTFLFSITGGSGDFLGARLLCAVRDHP